MTDTRVLLLSIPGLRSKDLHLMPALSALATQGSCVPLDPGFPAITCPVQASLTTGVNPAGHGIVANGLYDRTKKHLEMWISPDTVHRAPRIWDRLKSMRPDLKTAAWFLLQSKHASADLVCLPAPKHNADGTETMWCHTNPESLYVELRATLGEFPLHKFWGPVAGIESSQWIARSFIEASRKDPPHFAVIYLPHLDYAAQRTGPDSKPALEACRELDAEIENLIEDYQKLTNNDVCIIVAGEYQIRPVSHTLFPNRILREDGLLQVTQSESGEIIDTAASKAWALADHQISHVFIDNDNDQGLVNHIASLFAHEDGVGGVIAGDELVERGLSPAPRQDQDSRCGSLVIESKCNSWQAYHYWNDDALAPSFAHSIDIHRKPGYDPLELHVETSKLPTVSIPFDTSLIRGSHGARDRNHPHETILITSRPDLINHSLTSNDIADNILAMFT